MEPIQDYLLVEEIIKTESISGTGLKTKYDDTERFMYVKVLKASKYLPLEISKMYNLESPMSIPMEVINDFAPGNTLIINRVAKTPYKDGQYFISIKDVVAVESYASTNIKTSELSELMEVD